MMSERARAPARLGRRLFCAGLSASATAQSLGRTPYGGVLRLAVPWGLERIDPHALDDPIAALFAAAIADPLYAIDALGRPYPALAAGLPQTTTRGVELALRPGLVTARGRPLEAADVVASLTRARRRGALLPEARAAGASDRLRLVFGGMSIETLLEALVNPLAAVLPRNFSPLSPDATGPFAAELAQGHLLLRRNPAAARGPAFLDAIEVHTAPDLAEALRAFESGTADLGWLGAGLHRARADAAPFRGMGYGWAVLRTGKRAGSWGAPGVAQTLLDGIAPEQLRHLGVESLEAPVPGAAVPWGGGNVALQVADDAPQLVLIARALAALLRRPGHEIDVVPAPRAELSARRGTRDFALMVDFIRALGPGRDRIEEAFLSAENPDLAKNLSRRFGSNARAVCRTLTLGAIGELWVAGAHDPAYQKLQGWQLGNVFRRQVSE
jgi:peptide/nickel transport system substrate-binding protein